MRRVPLIALAATFLLTGLLLTACGAATGLPRWYTTTPKTAIKDAENAADNYRSGKFSDTKCWFSDGTRQDGWRHQVCVGNYEGRRGTFRYKLVSTPQSCTRFKEIFTVPRLGITKKPTFVWHHRVLTCKR